MPTAIDLLQQAYQLFQARRYSEAEAIYRGLLKEDPNNGRALEVLGVILGGSGRNDEAIALLQRAIICPNPSVEAFKNLSVLLHTAKRFKEAEVPARRAIQIKPSYADAHFSLGNALLAQGRFPEAGAAYQQALQIQPNHVSALVNLAAAWRSVGNSVQATACARQVVQLDPNNPQAHSNLGSLLRDQHIFPEALAAFQRAVQLDPNFVECYQNLAVILKKLNRPNEAIACLEKMREINPRMHDPGLQRGAILLDQGRNAEAVEAFKQMIAQGEATADILSHLGVAVQAMGNLEEALVHYDEALRLEPRHPGAWSNKGFTLATLGRLEEAMECYQKAISIRPDLAEVHNNLGNTLRDLGRYVDALDSYRKATFFEPAMTDAHWNRSLTLLTLGDFINGWHEYEWRWLRFPDKKRGFMQQLWDGSSLQGKTIMLHVEQGFGDTFQFIRYAPLVEKLGARVLLECEFEVKELVRRVKGVSEVYARGEQLPAFDCHAPLLSLAFGFGTTVETIPCAVPYLEPDPEKAARWRKRLEPTEGKLRVGFSWAGRPSHTNDRNRSLPLSAFSGFKDIPNVAFYGLQKWKPNEQLWKLEPPPFEIIDFTGELESFDDTAALISNFDLILSVDTSIVHLAGALGKKTWVLLPFCADFRWLEKRPDSPWYPTMRLFRQQSPHNWPPVLAQVAEELRQLAAGSQTT